MRAVDPTRTLKPSFRFILPSISGVQGLPKNNYGKVLKLNYVKSYKKTRPEFGRVFQIF